MKDRLYVNGLEVVVKTPLKDTLFILCLFSCMLFSIYSYRTLSSDVNINSSGIDVLIKGHGKNSEYLQILSNRESGGDWSIVGGYNGNYIGLYQFGNSALRDIKSDVRVRDFKRDKGCFPVKAQHLACISLMRKNSYYMRNYYKHIGSTIKGVYITEAGILASAHLVGHSAVKRWLRSNGDRDTVDGFGTSLVEYMRLMEHVTVDI